jgi:hypothetical protein
MGMERIKGGLRFMDKLYYVVYKTLDIDWQISCLNDREWEGNNVRYKRYSRKEALDLLSIAVLPGPDWEYTIRLVDEFKEWAKVYG